MKRTNSKYPYLLLFGVGIANIGEWVYFLALNLVVLEMTNSPLAVSVLYILVPLASLFTNFWSGSFIDRMNKRKLLIMLDVFRAILIFLLPSISALPFIYILVFCINILNAIFSPVSVVYMTKLIPKEGRKGFNALYSLVTSGAFLTGPAVAGFLFLLGTPIFAIYVNGFALLLSAVIMYWMPDLEEELKIENDDRFSFATIWKDWYLTKEFSMKNRSIMVIYFLFEGIMVVMASAVDSLEAAFAKEVLELSDSAYGFLVSIAGAGIVFGAVVNTIIVKKFKLSVMIGYGTLFVSVGYVLYAFSHSILQASAGFFILAFFMAAANTGFLTIFQNNVPVEVMGRISSVYDFMQSIFIILLTILIGMLGNLKSVQLAVILGVLGMLALSLILLRVLNRTSLENTN